MADTKKKLEYPHIFSELKVRGKVIKNRKFSGPMILEWGLDKNGFITERELKAFGDMAKGGTGVITNMSMHTEALLRLSLIIMDSTHLRSLIQGI